MTSKVMPKKNIYKDKKYGRIDKSKRKNYEKVE